MQRSDFRFFSGVYKRGIRENAPPRDAAPCTGLTNNDILKKMWIALELKDEDMHATLKLAGIKLLKYELTALFRNRGMSIIRNAATSY